MGGAIIEASGTACAGDDVVKELNDVFDHPHSAAFKYARNHNTFGAITNGPDNYQDLINAYITAGVAVSDTWAAYLGQLGRLVPQGPENIYTIAQARNDGLTAGVAMSTKKHEPKHGGHVHRTSSKASGGTITIDSPFPLPNP